MHVNVGFSSSVTNQSAAEAVSSVALEAKTLLAHMAGDRWLFRSLHPHFPG